MNFIKKRGNSVLGMQFRTCGNFQASTDSSLVESPKISTNTKATPQSLRLRFCESQNLGENQAKITESSLDSVNHSHSYFSNSHIFFAKGLHPSPRSHYTPKAPLFAFRESASLSPLLAKNRRLHFCNLKSDFLHHEAGEFSVVLTHNSFLDSAETQNLVKKSLQKFLLLFAFAKSRIPLNFINSNPPNKVDSQNLIKNNSSLRDSADSKQEANSSIADEFLGLCEASDKDKTKVYRGREPKRSLKSRCESKFALKFPVFDKDDFYFLLVALASILSLIYLISGASVSYKEAVLLRENSTAIAKIANFSLAHFSHNLGLDFSAKLPNLIFYTLNLMLIYLISNCILKFKRDSVLCVGIFALIPGVIMQASIVNDTILILSVVLFVCYIELRKRSTFLIYPLLLSAVLISKSAFMLCLALFFYTLFKNTNAIPSKDTNQTAHFLIRFWENRIANLKSNAPILIFAMFCFGLNLYLFGSDISGRPRGQSLDTIAELALLYSPPLFVYFVYTIYRNFAKGKANLLLYVSSISLIVSIALSVRQDVNKEIYMFMSLCGIPLMVRQMLSDIRLRLPAFQESYKKRFFIIIAVLLVESSALIFSKQIYRFTNDSEIFLNQFYIAKEVANELKARGISRVSVEGRMQERLAFYGIKDGGQKLRKVKRGGNVVVEYNGKIVVQYAI